MDAQRGTFYTDSVLVVYGREALTSERKAAELLARMLTERAGVRTLAVDDSRYDPAGWQTLVLVGHPDRNLVAAALMASHGVRRPSESRPDLEGYIVQRVGLWQLPTVIVVGSGRGCLYGVGAFLRAVDLGRAGRVGIPYLKLASTPAFPVRGSEIKFWQEQRAADCEMGLWSLEQWEEQIAELALWGINLVRRRLLYSAFDAWLDEQEWMIEDGPGKIGWEMEKEINRIIHDYGLQVGIGYPPNTIATAATRDEWHPGSVWPRLACPSLPAAHDRILYERLSMFRELEYIDHLFIPSFNVGGCECGNCRPWSRTYLELVNDTARFLHRYHPNAQIWISNQGFSPEENEWLWEKLSGNGPEWLQVVEHGPTAYGFLPGGGPATVSGGSASRRYPTMGTLTRSLQEAARRIPVDYTLVLGPDVTHTFQPQYGLEQIDPALLWLHTYESPFARPMGYHEVFRATAAASAGVALYSEGLYDDVNKALWAGWAWSPDLSPQDAILAYVRWWFGESAAQFVAEAITLSEVNWETPLAGNDQVEQVVRLLDQAEARMPPHLKNGNWRWTMWRLRGLLDLLAQQKLALADETHREVNARLREALTRPQELVEGVRTACELLDLQERERKLGRLKEEIRELDGLLHDQIGLHLPAVANLDSELTDLSWERRQLAHALEAYAGEGSQELSELCEAVALVLGYENPGPGGFYDDCGHIGRDPHFVSGHRIPGVYGLDSGNRPSANTFAAALGETKDVVFAYQGLNPEVDYQVQLTLVCPEADPDRAEFSPEPRADDLSLRMCAVQKLYASGFLVHDDLHLPHRVAQKYTFDVPQQAYSDGRLELRFVRSAAGHIAAVSEIWLIQGQRRT
jgi:hypothetical protein